MNEEKSKSEHKRSALAIKSFAETLLALSPRQVDQLQLPQSLVDAISEYRKIKSQLAQKRHLQHVANLLRHMEETVIDSVMQSHQKLISSADLSSPRFRLIEQWRTRLLEEGKPALTQYLAEYPCNEVQELRHLIKKARAEIEKQQPSKTSTLLFRFIRDRMP